MDSESLQKPWLSSGTSSGFLSHTTSYVTYDNEIVGHTYDIVVHIVPTILLNIVGHYIVCTTYDIVGLTS